MHSRALRILLVIVCICSVAATTVFIRSLENTLTARRAALRDFDRVAREATDALADLRAAQQAYLAFGQGAGFWMSKVDATLQRVTGLLATLHPSADSAPSKSILDQSLAAVTEFGHVDARIRGYLETGDQFIAADIVFSEGGETVVGARQHIERARLEEHLAFDRFEADNRKLEVAAAGTSAGIVLLMTAILALVPLRRTAETGTAPLSLNLTGAGEPHQAVSPPSSDRDLPLRDGDPSELNLKDIAVPPPEAPAHTTAALQSVAQICTDISRVGDPDGLMTLLSRAADVLDASGLVLWVGTASGDELRPVMAHGYTPEMVSRIPVVPRSANNAAAAAYRSGILQIVPSQSGSHSKGAVVAPVLSADGCVGVLTAEIRDGGETSATVQSLATIFAAQLAGLVTSTAGVPVQRATGTGPG